MNPVPNIISGKVIKACAMILAEQYEASVALIKVSRAYDSQNEFLHFLDHRMETFCKESEQHAPSPEDRRGFVRSLQGIVIEALEKAERAPAPDADEQYLHDIELCSFECLAAQKT